MRHIICLLAVSLLSADTPHTEAEIARAQQLYAKGDLPASEKLLRALVPKDGSAPSWAPALYTTLGVVYHEMGRTQEAEHWHMKARSLGGADPSFRARVLNSLAALYLESGQYGKAERVIAEIETIAMADETQRMRARANLAGLHMVRGRSKEAEELFASVLAWWEKTGNIRDAAVVLNNLGAVAMERRDTARALRQLKRSHDLWLQHMGGYHHSFLQTVANYGAALLAAGRSAEAEQMLARARAMAQESHGSDHEITARISLFYADALAAAGRKEQAKRIRSEAARAASGFRQHTVDVLDLAAEKK